MRFSKNSAGSAFEADVKLATNVHAIRQRVTNLRRVSGQQSSILVVMHMNFQSNTAQTPISPKSKGGHFFVLRAFAGLIK